MSFEKKYDIVMDILIFVFCLPKWIWDYFINTNLSTLQKTLAIVVILSSYIVPIMKYIMKRSSDTIYKLDKIIRGIGVLILAITLFFL